MGALYNSQCSYNGNKIIISLISKILKKEGLHMFDYSWQSHMCRLLRDALEFTALFLWGNRTIVLYNKQNNTWMLENMKLFLVLNRISHSFALLTREISWSTLEINFIFLHIRVLFPIYSVGTSNVRWKRVPKNRSLFIS